MKDLEKQLNKGWEAAKEGARNIGIEAGLVEPTMLEQAKQGVKGALQGTRKEFGKPSGFLEAIEELATSAAEEAGIKEPRVGKSLVEVIKSAFGMLTAVAGTAKEQEAASKKFDKACETFSRAMEALFKTKKQEHHRDTGTTKPAHRPKEGINKEARAERLAPILKRQAERKAAQSTGRGRGG